MATGRPTRKELMERVAALEAELEAARSVSTESQAAPESDQQRNALYRQLVENSNDLLYVVDADGVMVFCSPSVSHYGYEPQQVEGHSLVEFVHSDDVARLKADFLNTLVNGAEFFSVFRLVSADGTLVTVEEFGRPIRRAGRIVGISGVVRDISEHRRTEAALRESEQRYRTLVNNIQDGIWLLDAERSVRFANPSLCEMFGCSLEQMIGRPVFDFLTTESASVVRRCLDGDPAVLRSDPDIAFRRADGRPRWGSLHYMPVAGPTGSPDGWVVCVTDITRHRMTANALRESEEAYRSLVENVNIGVYRNTGGPHGRFLRANPAIAAMFGYESVASFMQIRVSDLYQNPSDRQAFVQEALREGYVHDKELLLKKRDGTPIWASCTARVKRDDRGQIEWMDGVIEDITARKEQEAELQASERRYALAQRAAGIGSWEWGLASDAVTCSDEVESLMGFEPGEFDGTQTTWFRQVRDDHRQAVLDELNRCVEERCEYRVVCPVVRHDREERWIEMIGDVVEGEGGEPVSVLGVCMDVTQRRRSEQAIQDANRMLEQRVAERTAELETANAVLRHEITERERTESDLAESENRYRTLAESAQEFIYIVDADLRVAYLNSYAADQLMRSPEEVVGRPLVELFGPSCLEVMTANLRHVFNSGQALSAEDEVAFIGAPMQTLWLETTLTPLFGEPGTVEAVMGISRNITERKHIEQEMLSTKNYLETLIDTSQDAIIVIDAEGRFEFGNHAAFDIIGWPDNELIGESFMKVIPSDLHPFILERWAEVQQGSGAPYEVDILRKNGERRSLAVSHRHMTIDGSRKYCVVCKDITDAKRAERALLLSEQRYRNIFDAAPLAFVMWDRELRVTDWNGQAEKTFGWSRDEVLGRQFLEFLIPEADQASVHKVVSEMMAKGINLHHINDNLTRRGELITCEWNNVVMHDDAGRVTGVLSLALDITERLRAERSLRESEERYRRVVEDQTEFVCRFGEHGIVTFVNEALCRYFGTSPDEMLGQSFFPVVHPDDLEGLERQLANLTPESPSSTTENRNLLPNGEQRWVQWTSRKLFDDAGRFVEYQAVGRDIDERKQSEEALRQSEERYRTLFENAIVGIGIARQGRVLDANPALLALYGCEHKEDFVGRSMSELVAPEDRAWLVERAARRQRGEDVGPGPTSFQIVRYDGTRRDVETASGMITIDDQPCLLSTFRDVTDVIKAQRRIERQARILANVTDAVAVVNAQRRVVYWSPGAEAVFGYTEDEMIAGQGLAPLLRDAGQVKAYNRELVESLKHQQIYANSQLPCRHKSGEELWVDIRISPFEVSPDEPGMALFVARDVTPQVQLLQRMFTAERMLNVATLGLSISHELNNMLGGLRGLADLAGDHPDLVPRLIRACRTIADRGGTLAERMTSLAKADTTGQEHRLNVVAVAEAVASMMTPALAQRNIRINETYQTVPFTWMNEGQMLQVLLNLITNARDSIGRDGQVHISISHDPDADAINISVRDTGGGIPTEIMPSLFDPFFTTKRENDEGEPVHIGLGLPESNKIIRHYGGDILVESEPGQGATFTVHLPVRSAPTASVHEPLAPNSMPARGTRILVADDDELMRFWLSEHLADRGYEVAIATSGREALQLCEQQDFEYIFLDMLMPGEIPGPDACIRIHAGFPNARIIICTAFVRENIPEVCQRVAFSVLKKPFGPDEVARAFIGDKKRE